MTTSVSALDVEHGPECRCDYCHEILKLCPTLAQPAWVRMIGEIIKSLSDPSATLDKKTIRKLARQKLRTERRIARLMAGGFVSTRSRKAA